jgi:hypothetical protein
MVVNKLLIISLLLLAAGLSAQNLKVMSSVNKTRLSIHEQVQLTLKVAGSQSVQFSEPTAPQVPGLSFRNMLSSSSSSTSFINGRMQSERSRSFTYIYTPLRTGQITIPGFNLKIAGKVYTTNPITIEVVDSPRPAAPQYSPDPFSYPFIDEWDEPYRGAGESLILCLPQSQTVYRGEPAIVSYYLYTDQSVRSFNLEDEKDWGGYGKAVYQQPTMLNFEDVTFRGERYKRSLLKSMVLFPQGTGRLQAPTLTGSMRLFDYGYLNKQVVSQPAYIEVDPLPSGAPEGFTGAVGSFSVSDNYSADQVNLGEAVTYTLKIRGRGNFSQFTAPAYPRQASFQISEPMAQDQLGTAIEGTRNIHYTVVPQQTGEFRLSGVRFSWFDTDAGEYRSFSPNRQSLRVKPANVLSYFSGILQSDRPKSLNPLLAKASYPAFRLYASRFWWWLAVILILCSIPASAIIARERRLRNADPLAYARKYAAKVLDRHLAEASAAAKGLSADFYPLAQSGLIDYLARKYQIPKGLSTDELIEALADTPMPPETVGSLRRFLTLCQEARFKPGGVQAEMIAEDLARLKNLVSELVSNRSHGRHRNIQTTVTDSAGEERT